MSTGWDVETSPPIDYETQPLAPAGTFPAAVVGAYEVGTHTEETDYGEADRRKLVIVYELAVPRPDGEPFTFAEYLTFSEFTNSNLYKRFTSLAGALPPGAKLNPLQLLGKPCAVSIAHREGGKRQRRTYANLTDVIAPMYGQAPYTPSRQPSAWGTFEGTPPPDLSWAPPIFGKTIKSLIESSHEARAGKFPLGAQTNPRPNHQHQTPSPQRQQPQPPPQQHQQPPQPQPQHQYPQQQSTPYQYHQPPQHQPPQQQQQQQQRQQRQQRQQQQQQQQQQGEDYIPF